MRSGNEKSFEVIFRHDKKDEAKLNEAFDFLFEEVFQVMNQKVSMVT